MSIQLRPYQAQAIEAARVELRRGVKRLIISAATGSGKTLIAMAMIRAAVDRGSRVSFIADRRSLVQQTSKRFTEYGIRHGILMGNDTVGTHERVRVESAQTIQKRGLRDSDLFVADEAHELRPDIIYMIAKSGAVLIGLTATPFPAALAEPIDSHLPEKDRAADAPPRYEAMVSTVTTDRLIADGHLCPFDVVAPVAVVDTEGVRVQGGEFQKAQLKDRIMRIVGEIVPTWRAQLDERFGGEVQPTIVFGATVDDAEAIQREFRDAGYSARLVSSREDEDENKRTINAFRDGEFDVLVNCAMLCLDAETEILTADGWKGREQMADGDTIAAFRPDGRIEWAPNEGIHQGFCSDRYMVGYGERFRVTGGHGMLARSQGAEGWKRYDAEDLVGRKRQVPVSGNAEPLPWLAPQIPGYVGSESRRVAALSYGLRQKGMEHQESRDTAAARIRDRDSRVRVKQPHELSLDECRFAGFWVGDGSKGAGGRGGHTWSLCQSKRYPAIVAWVDALISRLGFDAGRAIKSQRDKMTADAVIWTVPRGTGYGSQKRKGIVNIEPYLDKDAPYLQALTGEQFAAWWEGLLQADGVHGVNGRPGDTMTCANRLLVDRIQAAAVCRGWHATISPRPQPNPDHAMQWSMYLRPEKAAVMLGAGRERIERVPCDGEPVWCVTSPTGYIVTRRAGRVTITGNSRGMDFPRAAVLLDAYPMRKILTPIQRYGRIMRTFPGKSRAVVVDFGENWLHMRDPILAFYTGGPQWPPPEAANKAAREKKPDRDAICKECRTIIPPDADACPGCGKAKPVRTYGGSGSKLERVNGSLRLVDSVTGEVSLYGGDLWPEVATEAMYLAKGDKARARRRAIASYKSITGRFPPQGDLPVLDRAADPAVVDLMRRKMQAFAIARRAASGARA